MGATREDYPPVEHPVVRTPWEAGRKRLFVNSFFTSHFKGMTPEESRPLPEFLYWHTARPEFTCRYRWAPNAVNDYHGHRCYMYRVMINGDRPY